MNIIAAVVTATAIQAVKKRTIGKPVTLMQNAVRTRVEPLKILAAIIPAGIKMSLTLPGINVSSKFSIMVIIS